MNKVPLRKEFAALPGRIDWYPGHMRKAMRQLTDRLKKVDVFVEVRDARIPRSSVNPELISLLPPSMKRLVVYNKIDLVPDRKTIDLIKTLHETEKVPFMHVSTKENININKLITFIQKNANP
jgi:ribosome biogenesis GTPase A